MTPRDKVLAAFIPAGFVVLFYPHFRPASPAALAEEIQELELAAPGLAELEDRRAEVERIEASLTAAEAELEEQREQLTAYRALAEARGATVERLEALLERRGLEILREGPASSGSWTPTPLEQASELLAGEADPASSGRRPAGAVLRELELRGRYLDMLAALEALAADERLIVAPVRLDMRELTAEEQALGETRRVWLLQVWL